MPTPSLFCRDLYKDYLLDLIRIPSLTGEEGACAEYVLDSLKSIGFGSSPERKAFIDAAGNVVGILQAGPGQAVLLNTHLDVVPPGDAEFWAPYSPFGGHVEGDRVIGRGAADIKGGLAAQFFAFKYFKEMLDRGGKFNGTLIFSSVVHEEAAEMLGMQILIEETLPGLGLKPDLCILGEPTGGKVALGQRGKVELVITTSGKIAHSSQPALGINSLEKMLPVIRYIFEDLPLRLKHDLPMCEGSVTITDCVVKPGKMSVIPDFCEISVDRRYTPGEDIPALLGEFKNLFQELQKKDPDFHAQVFPRVYHERTWAGYEKKVCKHHPAWVTDAKLPIVKRSLDALAAIHQNPAPFFWKFGTDGSMTAALCGIPTIGYSHAKEEWAHQAKEEVSLSEMEKTVEGTIAMVAAVLGGFPVLPGLNGCHLGTGLSEGLRFR
ncbi:MAG: M20/M25/M40 family metallo-hydrolase [Treponema sp.]|jgi:putative selenium metabolism hydrolase|nr:M20/M25/M40 family metallo-hydrolase [Treponema sp.]